MKQENEELYFHAIKFARYKHCKNPYDFASWIVLKVLEGKYKTLNFCTAFIDYLRQINGSVNRDSFQIRKQIKNYIILDESKYSYPEYINEPHDCSEYVRPKYREIYKLVMQDCLKAKDVAKMIGVSESRISQIISECKKDIKMILHEER